MSELNDKPLSFQGGKAISAAELNKLRSAIPRLITGGRGVNVSKIGDRFVINLAKKQGVRPGGVYLAVILEVRETFLICDKDGAEILVAKPWGLRDGTQWPEGPSYNYETPERRVASGADSAGQNTNETQVITPDYNVGEQILAVRLTSARFSVDAGGVKEVVYEDINQAGRCWAVTGGGQ